MTARPPVLRQRLKAAVERQVVRSGLPGLSRRRRIADSLVLAYHNVVPDGDELPTADRSLHLGEAAFGAQLDRLAEHFEVVPLDDLLDDRGRPGPRPRAAITFDDAYFGALTAGVRALAARRLPATIFVAPAFVGGRSFWWDAFSGPEGPPPEFRAEALEVCGGVDERVHARATERGLRPSAIAACARCASEEDLRAAVAQPGITLGSHSWSHVNLAAAAPEELDTELRRPLAWLRDRFPGKVSACLSYPYGLHSLAVERAALAVGHRAGLLVTGGWIRASEPERFSIPRLNVPAGLSLNGFTLRTAGL